MKINIRHVSFQKTLAISLQSDQKINASRDIPRNLESLSLLTDPFYSSSQHYTALLNVMMFLLLLANTAQATPDQCVILTPPQEKSTMKSLAPLFANKAPCNTENPILGGLIINGLIPITEYCNRTTGLFLPYISYAKVAEVFDKKQYILPASIERNLDCIDAKNNLFRTWGIGGVPNEVSRAYAVLIHLMYHVQKFKDIFTNMIGNSFNNCINHIKTIEKEAWILDLILENYEAENCSNWLLNAIKSFNNSKMSNTSNGLTVLSNITSALVFNLSSAIDELYNQSNISDTQTQTSEMARSNQSVVYNSSNHSHNPQIVSFREEQQSDILRLVLGLGLGIPAAISLIYIFSKQIITQSKRRALLDRPETENLPNQPLLDVSTAIKKTANLLEGRDLTNKPINLIKMQCLLCLGMAILQESQYDITKQNKLNTLVELYKTLDSSIESETEISDSIEAPFLLTGEENAEINQLKTNVNKLWEKFMNQVKGETYLDEKKDLDEFIQNFRKLIKTETIPTDLNKIIDYLQSYPQMSDAYPV